MKPLVIIAGAGQTGRELACRLLENWRVVLVDPLTEKLQLARAEAEGVVTVEADATSYLNLRKAGVEQAQALVSVTGFDEANLEVCRFALERAGIGQVFAVVMNRAYLEQFLELGVQVVSRARALASALQTKLDPGHRTTSELGLGEGELLEITILDHSPVIGRSLSSFRAKAWLVGAIYREGKLVVPHGGTTIQEGDRVLLVGEPNTLPAVSNFFRKGASEFPLQYGSHVIVSDPEEKGDGMSLPEALHLASETFARSLKVLSAPYQEESTLTEICRLADVPTSIKASLEDWPRGLYKTLEEEDCGCFVVPGPDSGFFDWMGLGHNAFFSLIETVRQPCLLARGTFPYRRIMLVVGLGQPYAKARELAYDVTRLFDAEIVATAVLPPEFVSGSGHHEELEESLQRTITIGSYYSLEVEARLLRGHPVHTIVEQAEEFDLVVVGYHQGSKRLLSLDATQHILLRAPCSTLVLPS